MSPFVQEFKTQWFGGAVAMVPGTCLFFWLNLAGSRQWFEQYGIAAVVTVAAGGLLLTAIAATWIALKLKKDL